MSTKTLDVTKTVNQFYVTRDFFENEDILSLGRELLLNPTIKELQNRTKTLMSEINKLFSNDEWLLMENKKVYYVKSENLIIPNLNKIRVSTVNQYYKLDFEGFTGTYLTGKQAINLFCINRSKNPFFHFDDDKYFSNGGSATYNVRAIRESDNYSVCYHTLNNNNTNGDCNSSSSKDYRCGSTCGAKVPVFNLNKMPLLESLLRYDLIPKGLSNKSKNMLLYLKSISNYISINEDNTITTLDTLKKDILEENINKILDTSFEKEDIIDYMIKYVQDNPIELTESSMKSFAQAFLNCDKVRLNLESYDLTTLTDINVGHWDLWNDNPNTDNKIKITTKNTYFIARNPLADIQQDGLIGIDFGTKSTIIGYQNGSDVTRLRRIGTGNLSNIATAKDYENPTIMEFVDFEKFLEIYNATDGRPETRWQDIKISHDANNDFINIKDTKNINIFSSYIYDLKQWCGDIVGNRKIKLCDRKNHIKDLPRYLDLSENDIDPIEIYAYYLGMFINNMRNGIYLDYLMSFPVNYEKSVRERIIKSFTNGIKKSLPNEVLQDEQAMSKFRVRCGTNEPASYSVCALQQYGIEPDENENIFYGIFDFGGGTTDFDFGIWRLSDLDNFKERRYDYVIEHFGAGGDKYLGGENLLEFLSFEIFKANAVNLLKSNRDTSDKARGFTFYMPQECSEFDGSDVLIDNTSNIAKRNTKQLMEKLREFLENSLYFVDDENNTMEDDQIVENDNPFKVKEVKSNWKPISDGKIQVDLFNRDNVYCTGIDLYLKNPTLNIDIDLVKILENRIEKGITNFFQALKLALSSDNFKSKDIAINKILIFLAGNSSQSPLVEKIFCKHINEYFLEDCKKLNIDTSQDLKIYPPLGTDKSIAIQIKDGLFNDKKFMDYFNLNDEIITTLSVDDIENQIKTTKKEKPTFDIPISITKPTGKTGVVYGLLESRTGSKILVIDEVNSQVEIPFQYYIGISRRNKFRVVMNKGFEYNKWLPFIDALQSDFELYYSTLPEVVNGNISIKDVKKKRCTIPQTFENDDIFVYIRAVKSNVLEYVIAQKDEIVEEKYLCEPIALQLI